MSSNLDKIDDILECGEIMKSFGLPTKGFKSLDEMRITLCRHLKGLKGTSTRKVGEVSNQERASVLRNKYILVSRYQLIVVALCLVYKLVCCLVRHWFGVVLAL